MEKAKSVFRRVGVLSLQVVLIPVITVVGYHTLQYIGIF